MLIKNQAFTLLELLTAMVIFMVLCGVGLPTYRYLIERSYANTAITQLYHAIYLARSEAVKRNVIVTLCASSDHHRCSNEWGKGYIVFADQRGDGVVDPEDQIIKVFSAIKGKGRLSWRGFPNRNYLQMTPQGFTNYQNGTFSYYPANGDVRYARALLVSQSGRVRLS